jgi:hypothetical protein
MLRKSGLYPANRAKFLLTLIRKQATNGAAKTKPAEAGLCQSNV